MFGKNAERIDTFSGKQLLEEMDHEMILTMTGGSLENAVGNLFQLMRKQIFQEISYPIVQMEAKEVYFDEVQVQKETCLLYTSLDKTDSILQCIHKKLQRNSG